MFMVTEKVSSIFDVECLPMHNPHSAQSKIRQVLSNR